MAGMLAGLGMAASASGAAIWTSGHGDLSAEFLAAPDNEFELVVHLEGGIVDGTPTEGEIEAGEILTTVPRSTWEFVEAAGGRPSDAAWNPIGVSAGDPYWFLPTTDSGPGSATSLVTPFVGWGLEELDPADWDGDITLTLTGVRNANGGDFSVWTVPVAEPSFLVASADGIDGTDVISLAPGSHTHFNVGFSRPGIYEVDFRVDGTSLTEGPITGSGTYSFNVIPEPGVGLLVLLGLGGLALRRGRGGLRRETR